MHRSYVDESPPPYVEADEDDASNAILDDKEKTEPPPDYAEKLVAERREKQKSSDIQYYNEEDALRLPPAALYLLGFDVNTWEKAVAKRKDKTTPKTLYSPAAYDFEIVCLACFYYVSGCICPAGPTETIRPQTLPAGKKAHAVAGWLEIVTSMIGDKSCEMAAAVAQSCWPLMCQGMIPIFDNTSLVVLRSHAIASSTSAKAFMARVARPVHKTALSDCSCGKDGCIRVDMCWNTHVPGQHTRCEKSLTYTNPYGEWEAKRTPDGKSHIRWCDPKGSKLFHIISTLVEEDFFLYSSITAPQTIKYGDVPRITDPEKLSWDAVLDTLLAETLACTKYLDMKDGNVPLWKLAYHGNGGRAVLRGECFGAGTGFLIAEVEERGPEPMQTQSPESRMGWPCLKANAWDPC